MKTERRVPDAQFRLRTQVGILILLTGIATGVAAALLVREFSPNKEAWAYLTLGTLLALVLGAVILAIVFLRRQREQEENLRSANRDAVKAREEAIAASHAKSDFLATMSHEIRTPLSGILGYADLLSEEPLTPDQARYVERIQVAGHSLLTVVGDVLDFSRIESGTITLDPHPFSIRALVDNVVSIVSAAAYKKGLTVVSEVDGSLPPIVAGDQARIRQVLLNLLNNAVKFTHTGSVKLTIGRCGAASNGERIRFAVEDTGIGIPKERQYAIFNRFSQLDSSISRQFGGSGLGLAISQQLVNLMGGWIEVDSEPDRGSTFSFELVLPAAELADTEPEEELDEQFLARRILVVEDLEENRELARTMLQKAGFQVDCASNGFEAVEAVQKTNYLLVFMDVQMPKMDGISATKAIRSLPPPACDVPVVAMTANVLSHQIAEFRAAGMNDHIGKPYTRSALLAQIRKWQSIRVSDEAESGAPKSEPALSAQLARAEDEKVFDRAAVERVRELLGDGWVQECARRLRRGLDEVLEMDPGESTGKEVAAAAHKLVSQSSQLGFFALSRCCRDLEHACAGGGDANAALSCVRSSVEAISDKLSALIQGNASLADTEERQAGAPEEAAAAGLDRVPTRGEPRSLRSS